MGVGILPPPTPTHPVVSIGQKEAFSSRRSQTDLHVRGSSPHTLDTTSLVHETYLKLVRQDRGGVAESRPLRRAHEGERSNLIGSAVAATWLKPHIIRGATRLSEDADNDGRKQEVLDAASSEPSCWPVPPVPCDPAKEQCLNDSIFLLGDDGDLRALEKRGYVTEDKLQALLADHPQLLSGELVDPDEPRRWLLISREVGIPGHEGGGGRWSVDHLFLDQDAVPTLVEVKRSSDTRLRREVVGQLLEYAANSVRYWSPDFVRQSFESECRKMGVEPESHLAAFLEQEGQYEDFWNDVKTNLQAGKVRLLFVADEIPTELRRVVEFLNKQMDPAVVLAIEITQYIDGELRTLVPRVLGHVAMAPKSGGKRGGGKKWTRDSFFADLAARAPQVTDVAERLLDWAADEGLEIWWGEGKRTGSFVPILETGGQRQQTFAVWSDGSIEFYFYWWAYKPPFSDDVLRAEMLTRLNEISGVALPDSAVSKRPSVPLDLLADDKAWRTFEAAFDWFLDQIRID